jgi:PPK2 family polyphosphate:nucleotide phosphotransferase
MDTKTYLVKPGHPVRLKTFDPADTQLFSGDKDAGKQKAAELSTQLEALQELLYAEHKHPILIVLQGMDTSGKDGTIRSVFDGVNPQGVRVASFKAPTPIELEHDFLWRIHQETPRRGEIVIFNRSHYEDVLIVRVHELVSKKIWKKRYEHINAFERMLAEEGTLILKFFLHIDQEEQKERLLKRIDTPEKNWKFNPGDLKERERWDSYIEAYEDAIQETSTEWAPWYIIPANRKWYRNLVIAAILVDTLKKLDSKPPKAEEDLTRYRDELEKS